MATTTTTIVTQRGAMHVIVAIETMWAGGVPGAPSTGTLTVGGESRTYVHQGPFRARIVGKPLDLPGGPLPIGSTVARSPFGSGCRSGRRAEPRISPRRPSKMTRIAPSSRLTSPVTSDSDTAAPAYCGDVTSSTLASQATATRTACFGDCGSSMRTSTLKLCTYFAIDNGKQPAHIRCGAAAHER